MNAQIRQVLTIVSGPGSHRIGLQAMRVAIAVVFFWIGGVKFAAYEADSITPFVANSPVMSFLYAHPDQYAQHLTHEGELKPVERAWQAENHTYAFSQGLGTVELMIGALVLTGLVSRRFRAGRRRAGLPDAFRDAFFPCHDAGGVGPGLGRRAARLSLSIRCWSSGLEGCHADGWWMARAR